MTLNKEYLARLLAEQDKIISDIALNKPLCECLEAICVSIEALLDQPAVHASILLLNNNRLQIGAAPTIPETYCNQINGLEIGPRAGSCGSAMYTAQQVIVCDIEKDPLWHDFRDIALAHNLKACWSTPVFGHHNEVIASFAIYYETPMQPNELHLELIERYAYLSKLVIQNSYSTRTLRQTDAKLSALMQSMPDLAFIFDEEGTFVDAFGVGDGILFGDKTDLIGKKILDVIPQPFANTALELIASAIATNQTQILEYEFDVAKGRCTFEGRVTRVDLYELGNPNKPHTIWISRDITERKIAAAKIESLAFYDPLTELPNRRLLMEQLNSQIERAKRSHKVSALLYLDLDNFKQINDSLGHSAGDKMLASIAKKLVPIIRKVDTFARIGGDEFVILLDSLESSIDSIKTIASEVAEKIIHALETDFNVEGQTHKIGVSIGISLITKNDITTDEVLRRADTAMYQSKKIVGSCFRFYDFEYQQQRQKTQSKPNAHPNTSP